MTLTLSATCEGGAWASVLVALLGEPAMLTSVAVTLPFAKLYERICDCAAVVFTVVEKWPVASVLPPARVNVLPVPVPCKPIGA